MNDEDAGVLHKKKRGLPGRGTDSSLVEAWRLILGDEFCDELIAEVHRDIETVKKDR